MFFFDSTIVLLIPALIFAFWAQAKMKNTFRKYSQVRSGRGITGGEVARLLLDSYKLDNIPVERVQGHLTDHYDPRGKKLRLSNPVYSSDSLAALGVAAHETGHAIQHKDRYFPMNIRQVIYPAASFGSMLAFPLFFIGFLAQLPYLMDIGILFFVGALFFQVVTLPVEFNASRRALAILDQRGYIAPQEKDGVRKVLQAAALTYVAATAMAAMQLLRLLILRGRR